MRRLIAALVGVALVSAVAPLAELHVHAYTDHDHPDHHHGFAVHEHRDAAKPHAADHAAQFEGCDPGTHAVAFVFVPAPPSQISSIDGEVVAPVNASSLACARGVTALTDVRVHGPPLRSQASPRSPPPTVPA